MDLIKCFKALSDKTRLRLFYVLKQYELNVNEIVLVVGMIQSGVSRHLRILLESGLLTSRRDGSFIYYSAVKNHMAKAFINLVDHSFENQDLTEDDLNKAQEMIQIRQIKTKRFFKSVAPQWDRLKKEVLGDFDLNSTIIKTIPINGNISDLGCGTGELIELVTSSAKQKLIGIDSSPEMLNQSRIRLLQKDNAELRLGELEYLPMKNKEIDTAIMNMVLHHISQPQLPIAEAFRVLKSGGLFILSDFEKHDQEKIKDIIGGSWLGFEKGKVRTWLTDTGFHLKNIDSYDVNHGLVINVFTAKKP